MQPGLIPWSFLALLPAALPRRARAGLLAGADTEFRCSVAVVKVFVVIFFITSRFTTNIYSMALSIAFAANLLQAIRMYYGLTNASLASYLGVSASLMSMVVIN
jgi:phage shock protein PspC (stress-responsive transcriptional regulator)